MENRNPLVSIIIPVYNVEAYIKKCLNSVLNQSYENLQIIIVDDGSLDGSIKIAEEIKDERCSIVHKENGGLSSARNYGLHFVEGNYVMYVDSDDFLNKDAISDLLTIAIKYNCDIVQGGVCYKYPNYDYEFKIKNEMVENVSLEYFKNNKIIIPVWNKLYRYEFIKKLRFKEGYNFEDIIYTFEICAQKPIWYNCPNIVYNYIQRKGSIMHDASLKKLNVLDSIDVIIEKSKSFPYLLQQLCYWKKVNTLIHLEYEFRFDNSLSNSISKQIKNSKTHFTFNDVKKSVNLKEKIIYILYNTNKKLLFYVFYRKGKKQYD